MLKPPAPITRRTALKKGLTGVLACSFAPSFFSSRLFAQATAPSNRINVAVIGNGLIARSHIGTLLARSDVRIVAVCDVKRGAAEEARKRIAAQYGEADAPTIYGTHEEVLARPDVDAAFVCTPDHWHAPISLAAMRAGKDVYCEKPLTLTVREGRALADAARRLGRVLQTGTQQRSNAAFRKAASLVRHGYIGDIKVVRARLGEFPLAATLGEQPVPEDIDYDRWLGPTPWRPYHANRVLGSYSGGWRVFREYGGRMNGDWGAHHFDIIQWALGMDGSGPVEFVPQGYEGSPVQIHRYANGVPVERVATLEKGMIEFVGTKGTVWVARDDFLETDPGPLATVPLRAEHAPLYASDSHHEDFFSCVRTRQHPISDVEAGHRSASICHLGNIAADVRRPVRWDPLKEEIVGDPVAARLLDRPRRAPYAAF